MNLVLVGLNHKTAPVSVREQVAFTDERLVTAHRRLHNEFGLSEGVIVSTCNRVEIIANCPGLSNAGDLLKKFLYGYHSLQPPALESYLYTHQEREAIKHVFRVASSLDSMVLGESQILGQMKRAYAAAREAGSIGTYLNSLMHRAFFVAKRVRTETQISVSAVSVSYVAVELARKIFGDLRSKSILLLGAGKMSELAARNLLNSGIAQVLVANRTPERAAELASKFKGTTVPFDDLNSSLVRADIVLVSTGAEGYVLDKTRVQSIIRERKYAPLFVIDISVPRNVEPGVHELENVFLYDIDDLQSVIDANIKERRREASLAEEIVAEEVENYLRRISTYNMGPLINRLRERLESMCLEELEKSRSSLTPAEYDRLEKIMRRTARRIAHPLIMRIKHPPENPHLHLHSVETLKQVFGIDEE